MSKEKKVDGAEALDVFDEDGQFVRTYTEEQNDASDAKDASDKNFVEKAEEFAKKIGGSVKKRA
jgi:hypothetical protein